MSDSRPRTPRWVWPTVASVTVVVVAASIWGGLWLVTAYDAHGKRILDDPTSVVIAGAFTALAALAAPPITILVKRLGDIRHQVQNSHEANLRDDIDDKHDAILAKFDTLTERLDARFDRVERRVDRVEGAVDRIQNPKG